MDKILIESLKQNIKLYRSDVDKAASPEDREDIQRIANIANSLVNALEANDMGLAKQKIGGFSRSVSDAYCIQPPSFKALAKDVARIKSLVV
jgi:hypothetical protein